MRSIVFGLAVLLAIFNIWTVDALPIQRRGASYSGQGTFYTVGLGSCGQTSTDSQLVAALSKNLMASGKYCGDQVKVTSGGKSVTVKVVDTCPSCATGDIDFSPAAFEKLASLDVGRIDIQWSFV